MRLLRRYANSLANGGSGAGRAGRGVVLNTTENISFVDPREARRKQLMDFNELTEGGDDGDAKRNSGNRGHDDIASSHYEDEAAAGTVTLRRRPKFADNGVAARESRASVRASVYEDTVAASLSKLERDLIQVSKDEWVLKHPGQDPDKSPHWHMVEEQLRRDFADKFKTAERKRKTFHEEVWFASDVLIGLFCFRKY